MASASDGSGKAMPVLDLDVPGVREALSALPDAHLVVDREGRVLLANPRACELFAATEAELVGRPLEALVPEASRTDHRVHRRDFFEESSRPRPMGAERLFDASGLRPDGTSFPVEVTLSPVASPRGRLVIAAVRDGRAHRSAQERWRRVLEAAPDATLMTDRSGRIVLVTRQAERLFGYGAEELVGRSIELLVPERYRRVHTGHRAGYFQEPRARPMGGAGVALYARRKDGSEFPAEISLNPLETEDGLMALTSVRDVSERRRVEAERLRLAHAEEAVRLRDEFLSIASHELKTPLSGLQMQLETLLRLSTKQPSASIGESAARIERALRIVRRLAALVRQLLDVSRLTAGRLVLDRERVDLGELVRGVVEELGAEIARSGSTVTVDVETVEGTWDALRIEQVVQNLLTNAVKYGGGQPIDVALASRPDGWAVLTVRDRGLGIAPDQQARIFERFERNVSDRQVTGFGLGLWIAKQMVEAHGGRIGVESAPGEGSKFEVSLPREPPAP